MSSTILLLLFSTLGIYAAFHPGSILPPKVVAQDFYNKFMAAVNKGDKNAIYRYFSQSFVSTDEGKRLMETIPNEIRGLSFTIDDHAYYDIDKQPTEHFTNLNTTLKFRGPHPDYIRKTFEIILENRGKNPQMYPELWFIKKWIKK